MKLDLSDFSTLKPAAEEFKSKESALHVLTNNAGVMAPPLGSKDKQGNEVQIGTNLCGAFLLTKLLYPLLQETAKTSPPNSVRVTWAGSMAVDVNSFKPGGVDITSDGEPIEKNDTWLNYGQTKAGNLWLANEFARRFSKDDGVVHVCWNPGNLQTELQRHLSWFQAKAIGLMTYPPIFGAYTELYSAVGEDLVAKEEADYIIPWGRKGGFRADIGEAMKSVEKGGTGKAEKFYEWVEKYTAKWA